MSVKFMFTMQDKKSLIHRLHERMASYVPGRSVDVLHASEVTKKDFCPRQFWLLRVTDKKPKGQFISTSLRATFDLGEDLQNRLNTSWGVDWCIGDWKCKVCGKLHSFQKRPEVCECGYGLFQYKEPQFISPYSSISGSIDYIYDSGVGKYTVVEVKTIVKDDFKSLVAPLSEHFDRTNLYLRIIAEAGVLGDLRVSKINTDKALILYICKGYGCAQKTLKEELSMLGIKDTIFSPFKEFQVQRDDSLSQHLVDKALSATMKNIPDRELCKTSNCKQAKGCPVRKECWGL